MASFTVLVSISPAVLAQQVVSEVTLQDNDQQVFVSEDLSTAVVERIDTQKPVVIDLRTGERSVANVPTTGFSSIDAINRDGTKIAINASWTAGGAQEDGGLIDGYLYDVASRSITPLTDDFDEATATVIALSDNAQRAILSVSPIFGSTDFEFYLWEDGSTTPLNVPAGVQHAALSGDGKVLFYRRVVGRQELLFAHTIATDDVVFIAAPRSHGPPQISTDGSVVAWTEHTGLRSTARRWKTSGQVVANFEIPTDDHFGGSEVITADGSRLLGTMMVYDDETGTLQTTIWSLDLSTGERLEDVIRQNRHDDFVQLLAISADGREVIILGRGSATTGRWEEDYGFYHDPPRSLARLGLDGTPAQAPSPLMHQSLPDQITRLYSAFFLRAPDAGGLDFWMAQRVQGSSLQRVADSFEDSDEFTTRYGSLDDAAFVDLVYRNVLDRAPDAGGRVFWTARLADGMTRGQMMIGFSESPEYVEQTGTTPSFDAAEAHAFRLFVTAFLRSPDASGLSYWSNLIRTGSSAEEVAQAMMATEEWAETYGRFDAGIVVEAMTQNLFGTWPTEQDYAAFYGPEFFDSEGVDVAGLAPYLVHIANLPEMVALTGTPSF